MSDAFSHPMPQCPLGWHSCPIFGALHDRVFSLPALGSVVQLRLPPSLLLAAAHPPPERNSVGDGFLLCEPRTFGSLSIQLVLSLEGSLETPDHCPETEISANVRIPDHTTCL